MQSTRLLHVALFLWVGTLVLPRAGRAQQTGNATSGPVGAASGEQVWYTLGRVVTLAGAPVPGAKVAIYLDSQTLPLRKFETSYNGEFEISLQVEIDRGHRFKAVATKAGFTHGMEMVDLASSKRMDALDVVLRENAEDPDKLPFESLVSSVTDHVALAAEASGPGSEQSGTLKRSKALLDSHDSEGALGLLGDAVAREPKSIEYRTLLAVAMLQAGSWTGATRLLNETAGLNPSSDAGTRRSEPLLILGVIECWRGNPEKGTEWFKKGLEIDPKNPQLLQELGRSYLLQLSWPEADASLAQAIQAGAAPEAYLMRAEALLAEAKPADAQTEMRTYLGGRKPKDLPLPVRMSWIKLDDRLHLEIESGADAPKTVVQQSSAELLTAFPELQGIEPTKSQEELPAILEGVGEHVEAFFRDFHNTISREEIRQEAIHRSGRTPLSVNRSFQYLLLTWPDSSRPALDEYRTGERKTTLSAEARDEDFMLTEGFASAAIHFLPAYQKESIFVHMGRQPMNGHQTDVVLFAQRPEIARLQVAFRAGESSATTLSQGVAWIDRDAHQIIRMRTDLLFPIPEARLQRETTEIQYNEVQFKEASLAFWLPREVVVTVVWKGKILRNRHSYSDFHLFTSHSRIITAPQAGGEP